MLQTAPYCLKWTGHVTPDVMAGDKQMWKNICDMLKYRHNYTHNCVVCPSNTLKESAVLQLFLLKILLLT